MVVAQVCYNIIFAAGAQHFRIVYVVASVAHDAGWRTWASRFTAGTLRSFFTIDSADAGFIRPHFMVMVRQAVLMAKLVHQRAF